ncbi:chaperone [Fusarium mundagurra]|uniref:Chaperone n=1 Tax=Fusarium mundagurra TaxID=1567541 RepID=A0A8H6DPT8_9HYPO|nr:chaperone [Fusarium mundagurra]
MAARTIGTSGYRPPTVTDGDKPHQSSQLSLVPYDGSLAVLQNASLRNPMIAARKEIVDVWIENELKDATAADVESYRHILSSEAEIEKISDVVLSKITQGKRPNKAAIVEEIGKEEIIEFFVEYAFDLCIEKREAPKREAREEIERILDVLKARGNEYDVLGIDEPISLHDLRQLRRRILYLVHPDKNEDKEAQKCSKEVNSAADKLLSMNKSMYKPPPGSRILKEHKGVFGPGAFATGDTEPSSDEDSDEEDKVSVPDIPDAVKKVHEKVSKHMQTYFSGFPKGLPVFNDEIRKANNKIRNLNVKAGISGDYYQVDRDVLQGLKEAQVHVIRIRETQGAKEAEKQLSVFKGQSEKTCGQRNFQWPGNWSEVMVQAVRDKLDEINQSEPPPNKESVSDPNVTGTKGDKEKSNTDIDMLDADNVDGIILGYRSSRRYNRFQEQYLTDDITFFIQSLGASIFGVFSLGDLGHEISTKALSYYKDGGGNDVSTHIEAVTGSNPSITPATYNGILCIGAKKSGKPPEGRFPDTWIQIALKNDSDPSNAKIIHRTALRKLVKDADSQIERFYNEVGVEPPWAYTPYPDPHNHLRPRPLMFPAPRRQHCEYDRHFSKALPFYGNMGSIGYEEAAARRAPQTRSSGAQSQIASDSERLIAAMETLVLAMVEDREDRKRHQDYIESKLLGEG